MIVVGAKGFATEILEIFNDLGELENLVFFDDVNPVLGKLFDRFDILTHASTFTEGSDNLREVPRFGAHWRTHHEKKIPE